MPSHTQLVARSVAKIAAIVTVNGGLAPQNLSVPHSLAKRIDTSPIRSPEKSSAQVTLLVLGLIRTACLTFLLAEVRTQGR